ncbi:C4-dicarboxylate ABC transporter permease [Mannheimia granulomatis]|uniref:TRAP transporter small permease n=1 Tax=Mannheimia granulomatis TaxID=85402 RepID=UPI00159DD9FD|nr:TRAP transporter small permease [Mannheimia granulomatis]QLB14001.1 C4-dicarboxylate ABC transporter permease [Mannheimia granulomatis]
MDNFVSKIDKVLSVLCVIISILLVTCVVWQVFSRFILKDPSVYTDELARFAFIWVGLIGAAYAFGQKKHLAIDLLATKLESSPDKLKRLNFVVNSISLCFILLIMCYGGVNLVNDTMNAGQVSPVLGVEMGLVYSAIPLSGFFMLVYVIRDLFALTKPVSSLN